MATRPDSCPTPDLACPADRVPPATVISDSRRMATADMEILEQHIGLVLTRVEDLSTAAVTPKHITDAVQAGLIAALSDERTWAAAAAGIKASARREAGTVLVDAMGNVVRKMGLFVVAGLLVYWIGGWSALAAVWGAVFGGKP